jgi:beta-glucosidase
VFVGYRWFDTKNIEPLFAFGFGLSYTTFEYSKLKLTPSGADVLVQFELENTGQRAGAEVVQVYVQPGNASVPRPIRELKAFQKITLKPGEKQKVRLLLAKESFAFFDDKRSAWVAEQGSYQIVVGASSRDLRLSETFRLDETSVLK